MSKILKMSNKTYLSLWDLVTKVQHAIWTVCYNLCSWLLNSEIWFTDGNMMKIEMQKNAIVFYFSYKNYSQRCKYFKKIIVSNNNLQTPVNWLHHFNGITKKPCSNMIFKNFACSCLMLLKWLCNKVGSMGRLMNYIKALIQILLGVYNVNI